MREAAVFQAGARAASACQSRPPVRPLRAGGEPGKVPACARHAPHAPQGIHAAFPRAAFVGNRAKRPFAVHPRAMAAAPAMDCGALGAARAGGTEAP